jgi:hypothetical protein
MSIERSSISVFLRRTVVNLSISRMYVHIMETFELNMLSIDLANLSKQWPHLVHVPRQFHQKRGIC